MLRKYLCCIDLTLATRFISFLGITISFVLVTVLLSDKFGSSYDNSRFVALALGLDWQHFHPSANATKEADPEGRLISAIVIVYSFLFITTNTILLFGTIMGARWCAILWMVFEGFGTASKIGALMYHSIADRGTLTKTFLTGSIIYIVAILWCLLIVYTAQMTWKYQKRVYRIAFSKNQKCSATEEDIESQNATIIMSPTPYVPNTGYDII